MFLNYHILLIFTSFIAPEGFLNDVKELVDFVNLLAFMLYLLLELFYSRMYLSLKVKFLLALSIFAPLVYLFFNLEFLNTIEIPDVSILIASFLIINLFIKDFKYNFVRHYLNVLIDPFYTEGNDLFLNEEIFSNFFINFFILFFE